jgi:hypothetical protein
VVFIGRCDFQSDCHAVPRSTHRFPHNAPVERNDDL